MDRSAASTEKIARAAFGEIAASFPRLEMIEEAHVQVEMDLHLPVQPGLKHRVWLSFQNSDELHLSVGHFWCEWFPCTDEARVRAYVDAVRGFLSGAYRSLEHHRNGDCFKAQLQRPVDGSWETVATWSKLRMPSFSKTTYRVIANV